MHRLQGAGSGACGIPGTLAGGCSPLRPARAPPGVGLRDTGDWWIIACRAYRVYSVPIPRIAHSAMPCTQGVATPLYRRIVEHFAAAINAGVLKPGDWLPTHSQLAEEWECSLTPVRHAMSELEHAGLIENLQGKGARVL